MTMRKSIFLPVCGAVAAAVVLAAPVHAETKISPETAEAVTEGDMNRFSLVEADGDILRIDRQNGTVSICREQNSSWRCNPVPLAEEAYLAEINELAAEVDRLTARLNRLEPGENGDGGEQAPGSGLRQPDASDENGDQTSKWTEEDEELERVLTFTESAMRRFFGMVRELQKDFEGQGN